MRSTFVNWNELLLSSAPSPRSVDTSNTFTSHSSPGSSVDEFSTIDAFYSPATAPLADFLKQTQLELLPVSRPQTLPIESPIAVLPSVVPSSLQISPTPGNFYPIDTVGDFIEVKRGPGRPLGKTREKYPAEKVVRKRRHNESAANSRARFSGSLEKLWCQVPEHKRVESLKSTDPSRPLSRAEKLEIVLEYMKELQKNVGC